MIPTNPENIGNLTVHNSRDMPWFPFNIPEDAWQVQDADEEIFLLYSQLQTCDEIYESASGLGSVDSRQSEITVRLDVQHFSHHDVGSQPESVNPPLSRASRRGKAASKKQGEKPTTQDPLEIQLFQDTIALRSRKGETGSVLWRASVHLVRLLLSQPSSDSLPLLPATALSSCHALELGSGTGLLSIVFTPLVAHYTATDLQPLLPLIRKNVAYNLPPPQLPKISINSIDWVELHNTPAHLRHKIFSCVASHCSPLDHVSHRRPAHRRITLPQSSIPKNQRPIDLIIAVDCIYNPSLIAPLLDTINYLAMTNTQRFPHLDINDAAEVQPPRMVSSTVLIVLELRAVDVSRDFLHAWLELPGRWEIWSIPGLGARFAMWVGRRRDETN